MIWVPSRELTAATRRFFPGPRRPKNEHLSQQFLAKSRFSLIKGGMTQSRVPRNLERSKRRLVSCPRNTRYFAGGQLVVFRGQDTKDWQTLFPASPSRCYADTPIRSSLAAPKFFSDLQCTQVGPVFPAPGKFLLHQACQGRSTGRKHLLQLRLALERCFQKIAGPLYFEIASIKF